MGGNTTLKSKVFSVPGAEGFLLASGFKSDDDTYVLPREAALPLVDIVSIKLREHLEVLGHVSAANPVNVEAPTEWSCPTCTLLNPSSFTTCDACGAVKP